MALRAVPEHPKFAALKDALGLKKYQALGILESLWHFTGKFTPQGNVGKFTDSQIEAWLEWDQERGALIAGLIESGWLDVSEQHRLVVHDWKDHADQTTKKQLGRTKKVFVQDMSGQVLDMSGQNGKVSGPPAPAPAPEPVPVPSTKAKPSRGEREVDTRFAEFRHACEAYYRFKGFEMTWDASEAKHLSALLVANPALKLEQFQGILRNRSRSTVVHSERPRKWLGNATDYTAGPLDKFGKPLEAGDAGRPFTHAKSKSGQVLDDLRRSLEEDGYPVGFGQAGHSETGKPRQGDDGPLRCGPDADGDNGRSLGAGITLLPPAS